jgi:transposase, IS6 family
MMVERGLHVDHTTIYRWVQHSAPELERRYRPHVKSTTASWRVDETYIKVKKQWMYLYRAVDSEGSTLDFFLSATRDATAAKEFLLKTLTASHTSSPRVIGRWTKTPPTQKRSTNSKQRESFPKAVHSGK